MDTTQIKTDVQNEVTALKSDWGQPTQRILLIALGIAAGVIGAVLGHLL